MKYIQLKNGNIDDWGYLPYFFKDNGEPLIPQLDRNYQHGGGWRRIYEFVFDPGGCTLDYPGDSQMEAKAVFHMENSPESIYLFPHALVCVHNRETGDFEVARMD